MDFEVLGELIGFQGMNLDVLPEILPPEDQSVYLVNGNNILIKNGKIEKLRGTDYLNSISTQQGIDGYRNITGLAIYRKYSTGAKYLMAAAPRNLYYLKTDSEWYNLGTITNGGNDSVFSFANIENIFVFTQSDSTFIWYWDGGATIAKLFTPPLDDNLRARFLLQYKTHLVLLRTIESTVEYYQRVWISDPGDIDSFPDEYKLDIDAKGVIRGGLLMENEIIVYLDDSIHRIIYGEDPTPGFYSEIIADSVGLWAARTLTGNKDVHFFLDKEGLMRFIRGDVPRSVSDRKFNKLILDQIDPAYYYRAAARFYPHLGHLFLTYPKSGSTYNDVQLIYDVRSEELISKKALTIENYSSYGEFEKDLSNFTPDERKIYGLSVVPIIGNTDGYIKEQKIVGYQDGVSNYESNAVAAPTFWKEKSRNKRVLQADFLIEKMTDDNITFVLDLANEMNENYQFSYTVPGTGNTGTRRYECRDIDCFGKEFTVKIKDSNNAQGWKLHGIIFRGYYAGQK
jgi:hypothetical protein